MAVISGMGTSYDFPQHIGDLFQKNEKPNAVLRLVGGLTGALRLVGGATFPMGVNYQLAAAAQPNILEGADPTPSELDTSQASNVVQIFQESVKHTYSALGENQTIDGVALIPGGSVGTLNRPGTIEWQLEKKVQKIARDANYTFLRGVYQSPANNSTARRSRGFRTAASTHVTDASSAALSKSLVETLLQTMVENGALGMGETIYVLGSAAALNKLVALYESATQVPVSRDVVGVQVRTIVTNWATMELVWEPDVAAAELVFFQPQMCQIVAMPIPGKGVLFSEMLAKTGAAEHWQVYGEMGLDYRDEFYHGVLHTFT